MLKLIDVDNNTVYINAIGAGSETNPFMSVVSDYRIAEAINQIKKTYSQNVSVHLKGSSPLIVGSNPNLGTSKGLLWQTGADNTNEVVVADDTNPIDSISSSDAGDTETVTIIGVTMAGGIRTSVIQSAILNGQTKVALSAPLNQVIDVVHGEGSSTDLIGPIYIYQDTPLTSGKPTDTLKIHLTVGANENKANKGLYVLDNISYLIFTGIDIDFYENTGTNVVKVRLEVKKPGGVFIPITKYFTVKTGESKSKTFDKPVIAPKNSEVRIVGICTSTGQEVCVSANGYLAEVYV